MTLNPRKAPVQKRSKATVNSILEAAAQVLGDKGIAGFTTNAIAARAGVSIGTLYQYYPDKAAIAAALSCEVRAGMIARITCAVELAKPLPLKCGLHLLAEASIKSDATRPKFARWLDELEAQLGLSGAAAIPLDRYLTELIADYLETKFPGNSRSVLTEVADDLRATGGALANAVLRRGTIVDDNTVSKIVTVSLALLSGSFGRLS